MPQKDATLVEPMECLSVSKLPKGSQWVWEEIKLDGYRGQVPRTAAHHFRNFSTTCHT